MRRLFMPLAAVLLGGSVCAAQTSQIRVDVEAVFEVGVAPVLAAFSDGSFDIFDSGSAASASLETLAETGSPGEFSPPEGGVVFGPAGEPLPPIFLPEEGMRKGSAVFTVSNTSNRFNAAAMVLPSNDWFLGIDEGVDISALLGDGAIGETMTIDLNTVWDAGTEVSDYAFAADNFIIGVETESDFMLGADQNGVVTAITEADPYGSLDNLAPAGLDTTPFDFVNTTVATITLTAVPEPNMSGFALLAAAFGPLVCRRRRR